MATTKHILLVGSLNEEMADKLAKEAGTFYFDANGLEKQQNITIHLSSCGGDVEAENAMLYIINSQPERFCVVANGEISSAAFGFFFRAECDKTILPGTIGMYHLSRRSVEISLSGKGFYDADKFHLKHFKTGLKEELIWCEGLGVSAKEIELIAKGHDVYFTTEQLKGFLTLQQIEQRTKREAKASPDKGGAISCVVGKPKVEGGDTVEQLGENNQLLNDDREPQD